MESSLRLDGPYGSRDRRGGGAGLTLSLPPVASDERALSVSTARTGHVTGAAGGRVLPSLFHRWRRMEAAVMADREIRLTVGVTSTCRILRPRDPSGALEGNELFMAFAT